MVEKLTAGDVAKIREEIRYRSVELAESILEDVKAARAQGDLSENYEYYAAKQAKRKNDSRIGYLKRVLDNSVIISTDAPEGVAAVNRFVSFIREDNGKARRIKLVTHMRGDTLAGKVSLEAPLAKALLGRKAGDRSRVVLEDGRSYFVRITGVEQGSEDEDEIKSY